MDISAEEAAAEGVWELYMVMAAELIVVLELED